MLNDLKLLITEESNESGTWYYIAHGEKYDELMGAYHDALCNFKDRDNYEENEEWVEKIEKIEKTEKPTAEFLKSVSFYDGCDGFGTVAFAEGNEIIPIVLDFYEKIKTQWWREKYLESYPEDVEKEEKSRKELESDPASSESLLEFLGIIEELIMYHNDCQYGGF